MRSSKRVAFASDLHLGSNLTLDDFTRDREFEALVELSELKPGGVDQVDLVFLGDSFDLWRSVSENECRQEQGRRIELAYDGDAEAQRMVGVQAKHRRRFEALGSFGQRPGCRLVFVVSNHDHSLFNPAVQAHLADHLGLSGSNRLSIANLYGDPGQRLHGDYRNQYDRNNTYADFARLDRKEDCRGYYFVKLLFNRLEHRDPRVENSPSSWDAVWHWLRRTMLRQAGVRIRRPGLRSGSDHWRQRNEVRPRV